MDCAPGKSHAGVKRPLMRVQSFKGWQERRVDIDQAVDPFIDKRVSQQAHKTGRFYALVD